MDSRLLLAEPVIKELIWLPSLSAANNHRHETAWLSAAAAEVPHRPCYLTTGNWWYHREEAIWQADGIINGSTPGGHRH